MKIWKALKVLFFKNDKNKANSSLSFAKNKIKKV